MEVPYTILHKCIPYDFLAALPLDYLQRSETSNKKQGRHMEEFGTDSGVLLKASETCLSKWGQWVRHTVFFFLEGFF